VKNNIQNQYLYIWCSYFSTGKSVSTHTKQRRALLFLGLTHLRIKKVQ